MWTFRSPERLPTLENVALQRFLDRVRAGEHLVEVRLQRCGGRSRGAGNGGGLTP